MKSKPSYVFAVNLYTLRIKNCPKNAPAEAPIGNFGKQALIKKSLNCWIKITSRTIIGKDFNANPVYICLNVHTTDNCETIFNPVPTRYVEQITKNLKKNINWNINMVLV